MPGGVGVPPPPGTDVHITGLKSTPYDAGPNAYGFTLTAERSDGQSFSTNLVIPRDNTGAPPPLPGADVHTRAINVTRDDQNPADYIYTIEIEETDGNKVVGAFQVPKPTTGGGGTPGPVPSSLFYDSGHGNLTLTMSDGTSLETQILTVPMGVVPQELKSERVRLDGTRPYPPSYTDRAEGSKVTLVMSSGHEISTTFPDVYSRLSGVRRSDGVRLGPYTLAHTALLVGEKVGPEDITPTRMALPAYFTTAEVAGGKLVLTTVQYTPGMESWNVFFDDERAQSFAIYSEEVDLSGLGGGGGGTDNDTKVTGLTAEYKLKDTGRRTPDGAVVSTFYNELKLTTSDGVQFVAEIPDTTVRFAGVGVSLPVSNPQYNLETAATMYGDYKNDDGVTSVEVELPSYFTKADINGDKLRLTTIQYTPGHRNHSSRPTERGAFNTLYTSEVDLFTLLPPGGGGATWRESITSPNRTNDTRTPTTMVGGRTMLLGEPDKWVEIELSGEVYLMPVWKRP